MSEVEKKAVSSDPSLELEPVNMYVLFARMFADIAREVEADFGVTYLPLEELAAKLV